MLELPEALLPTYCHDTGLRMKVLVADDEPMSRRLLERSLRQWGYEVSVAHDGLQALQILREPDSPKLIILDWLMPGKDGVELCREIRQRTTDNYSYVLLLTSKRAQCDVIKGLESGADDYLTKPFHLEELQARLRTGKRIIRLMDELVDTREALRELAMHDALTGLWNRAAIGDSLERELIRSRRESTALSVIMVDLDHFKSINDTFGHPAGDAVLRSAAQLMKSVIRPYDLAGRYGGEEFLIVLVGCEEVSAAGHASRLRNAFSKSVVSCSAADIHFTASFGVASLGHDLTTSASRLIERADEALYAAKRDGRNRVAVAASELETV